MQLLTVNHSYSFRKTGHCVLYFNFRSKFSCESTRKFTSPLLPLFQDITNELYTKLKKKFNVSDMSVEALEYYRDISTKTAETYKNKKDFLDIAVSIGLNFGEVGNTNIYCIIDEEKFQFLAIRSVATTFFKNKRNHPSINR